jgi:hypothetical protein
MALQAPKAIFSMLEGMGCIGEGAGQFFVLVKEGTREVDGDDWKISFHFVFQIIASIAQFQCIYEMIMHGICCMPGPRHLAFLMGMISLREYEESVQGHDSCKHEEQRDRALSEIIQASLGCEERREVVVPAALLGVDMHPAKNAFQGLACLGSKKKAGGTGNRLLGMMRVQRDETGPDMYTSDWVQGYCSEAHPLLVLAEASVIMPGPRCIALSPMERWLQQQGGGGGSLHLRGGSGGESLADGVFGSNHHSDDDENLHAALQRISASEAASMKGLLLRLQSVQAVSSSSGGGGQQWGSSYARGLGFVTGVAGKNNSNNQLAVKNRVGGSSRQSVLAEGLGGSFRKREDALSAVPEWFRACCTDMYRNVGGMGFEHGFRTANTSMQYISKPCIVTGRDEDVSIVHVSRTEICMCMLSLMEIPFKVDHPDFCLYSCLYLYI